jgi:hypothetical protein
MEAQQSNVSIGLIFWPALALMYGVLIIAAVWFVWG